jgi:hypothetical protein
MSLAFDENGRPFIILREQEKKKRVKGLEAHKVKLQHNSLIYFYSKCNSLGDPPFLTEHFISKQSVNHHPYLDQYYGGTHCSQSLKDLTWTQRHG